MNRLDGVLLNANWIPVNTFCALPNKPYVYVLRICDAPGVPVQLGRFVSQDANGILYIGISKNKYRVRYLARGMVGLTSKCHHKAAENFWGSRILTNTFSNHQFEICYKEYRNQKDIVAFLKQLERSVLNDYRQIFGELPPLNSSKGTHAN